MKNALADLPAIPAGQAPFLPGAPANLGTSELLELPQSGAVVAPSTRLTDPKELVRSALAILSGGNSAPSARPELPLPPSPPLRADAAPSNLGSPDNAPTALPLQLRTLSDGSQCALPIRYFDSQLLIATYLVDYGRAAALLKDSGVIAVPQGAGQALAAFGCFHYNKTDIGAYNEVALGILASTPKSPLPALYILHLPVDTEAAHRAGVEIWGYNKFLASIDIAGSGNDFSMAIRDPDNVTIARFKGTRTGAVSMPPNDIVTFSVLDGQLIRTAVKMMTPSQVGGGVFSMTTGESGHPMAGSLRALGLDRLSPVLLQYAEPFQSLLFAGHAV